MVLYGVCTVALCIATGALVSNSYLKKERNEAIKSRNEAKRNLSASAEEVNRLCLREAYNKAPNDGARRDEDGRVYRRKEAPVFTVYDGDYSVK